MTTVIASVAALIAAAAPTARYGHAVGPSIHNTRLGRDRPLVARLLAGIAAGHARRPIISLNKNISLARRVRAAAAGRQAGRQAVGRSSEVYNVPVGRPAVGRGEEPTNRTTPIAPALPASPRLHPYRTRLCARCHNAPGRRARAARQGIKINRILSRRYRRRVHAAFH